MRVMSVWQAWSMSLHRRHLLSPKLPYYQENVWTPSTIKRKKKKDTTLVLYQLLNNSLPSFLPLFLWDLLKYVLIITTGELCICSCVGSPPEMPCAVMISHTAVCLWCWVNTMVQVAASCFTVPAAYVVFNVLISCAQEWWCGSHHWEISHRPCINDQWLN